MSSLLVGDDGFIMNVIVVLCEPCIYATILSYSVHTCTHVNVCICIRPWEDKQQDVAHSIEESQVIVQFQSAYSTQPDMHQSSQS